MSKPLIEIKNLSAGINGKQILKGINLTVRPGEVHAIMGPNGSGKSTLGKVLVGHPAYEVTGGEVTYEGKNLFELEPDERARAGVFMGFQHPIEVRGVSNAAFLRLAYNKKAEAEGRDELAAIKESFETPEAKRLLAAYAIPVAQSYAVDSPEAAAQVELALEGVSPFPLAQMYYGWFWLPGAGQALAFAAYRRTGRRNRALTGRRSSARGPLRAACLAALYARGLVRSLLAGI